ncbi:MAG: hypothetical protein OEV87_06590 [Phycisphaerae bacterium]|nr:hypothetical protein [Phycisphaerae bacterium]
MFDGLWTIEFRAEFDYGSGVLVINGNQALGGDFGFYYFGEIDTSSGLTGEIDVVRFSKNAVSVFGKDVDNFRLLLKNGTINEKEFQVTANLQGHEEISMQITGKKKVDLYETK